VTPVDRFTTFIIERWSIHQKRQNGRPWPWTDDVILRTWKFCNVQREDDRVTRWIADNWRRPHAEDPDLWFAMMVARFVNWPATLAEIGFPVPWDAEKFMTVMKSRKARGAKSYGGAYMIRADSGNPGRSTSAYQVTQMFNPYWNQREILRPRPGDTLNSYHMTLGQLFGLGSFMAAQIVADLKYVEPLASATDWWTFAASGPGSRRGLNRVLDRPVKASWTEEEWRLELGRLIEKAEPRLLEAGVPRLHAQDWQNCCCEFSKHEAVRTGEGKMRSRYTWRQSP
jgi:hypothetical protein